MSDEPPSFIQPTKRRGRRAAGIRYENRVHVEFEKRYPGYLRSMWFNYADAESDSKWCQTDGILVDPWKGRIIIVEAKLQHTDQAYWQLFKTYYPVIQFLFGSFYTISCCEVVKWYDVATATPVRPTLCKAPEHAKAGLFNVHIWS